MIKNKNRTLTSKLKSIIALALLFVVYSSFSQTTLTNVKPFTLDVKGGINVPINEFKDYANNGFQVGLMLNKGVFKNLALGVSANYNQFGLKDNFESPDNDWTSISLGIGPQYTLPINMFFIQLYGHIGMSLIKTPSITQYAQNLHDSFDKKELDIFKLESNSNTGFHTDLGIKLGAQLSKRVSLIVGSTYSTSLNSPIKYSSRDLSEAIHSSGEVNMDLINRIPFEENGLSFSSFNVNAGVSISLGKTSAARPAQDYNSSRSNRPTPMREIDNNNKNNNDSVPRPLYAQDYNSSRSNKPSPIAWSDNINENDTTTRPAQDYNSSRSNRPTPISEVADNINDTIPRSAQDYNSSRSNKPRPIVWSDAVIGNDTVSGPLHAQDYNSSRSNKPRPIAWSDDKFENDSAIAFVKDYNASRKDYDAKKPKEPRSITPPNDGNVNDSVQEPLYAQDYNSSRSNKPRPISIIDDIKDINNEEDEVVVIGKLITIDIKSRSFELIDKKKQKISGKFQQKVTNEEIKRLKSEYQNREANIHVKINKTKLETGKEVVSYQL